MTMDNVKKYSCNNCNEPFKAYPPDDVYVKARINSCLVCKHLGKTQIKRTVECENCDHLNTIYWHIDYVHTVGEHNDAKRRANYKKQDAGINTDLKSNYLSKKQFSL